MAKLETKDDLVFYIFRKLGYPVLEINVDEDQVHDRIDEALDMFNEYHDDGSKKVYLSIKVTKEILDAAKEKEPIDDTLIQFEQDKFILQLPSSISEVVKVLPVKSHRFSLHGNWHHDHVVTNNYTRSFFDFKTIDYFIYRHSRELAKNLFQRVTPIRYQRYGSKLHIDTSLDRYSVDDYIVIECYLDANLEDNPEIINDIWFKRYCVELVRQQWATNLSLYENMQLPGGLTVNASDMLSQANDNIEKLEEELRTNYEQPLGFYINR